MTAVHTVVHSMPVDNRPRVVLADGDPGPAPVAVRQVERGLFVAVIDTARGLSPADIAGELAERFAAGYLLADTAALLA